MQKRTSSLQPEQIAQPDSVESFQQILEQGSAHAWLFFPSAILLGALHGLEPGHSKTMMAAFIIAVRGTIGQAVLLGLSAALSHSALIWALAAAGLYYGGKINAEEAEPWFQLLSAVIVAGMALWMLWRTRRDIRAAHAHEHGHHHHHDHEHTHHHHGEHTHHHDHDDHAHSHHGHGHAHDERVMEEVSGYQDEHEKLHAEEIERRFAGKPVTTGQIVLFGLTGGLMPCPAALTVLVICLQLRQFTLGFALVLAFSFGLALTLVATGVLAAWSLRQAQRRFQGLGELLRRLPYFSVCLLLLIATVMALEAWHRLARS